MRPELLRLLLLLSIVVWSAPALADTATYSGMLIPEMREPPIPIVVELDESRRRIAGRVTTSTPLTGEGRIVDGQKKGYECSFRSDIGAGRTLTIDGYCLQRTLEGKYILQFPDGTSRSGDFRLNRAEQVKSARTTEGNEIGSTPTRTVAACLAANSSCLAACPRGDYNAEFVCSNRCRLRLAACRGKATGSLDTRVESGGGSDR